MNKSWQLNYKTYSKRRLWVNLLLVLCICLQLKAESTYVVQQFGDNLTLWANTRRISNLRTMEELCSKSPSFRIGDTFMASMADKNSLTKTDTYDWDNYITCLQKEVDNGVNFSFSNVSMVPDGYIDINYPGLKYVSCNVRVNGTTTYEWKDLFILKDEKIVKITDYNEKVDEISGNKKLEIDYLELARIAFADGDYQKCYKLYKEGGLKALKEYEKRGWNISDANIFPYIESCVALKDWEGAMFGFTRTMNRKYWVNGIEWKLNPEDISAWNKDKTPLMNILLEKIYRYYSRDINLFLKSPLILHVQQRTGASKNEYQENAALYFFQNVRSYADRVTGLKAAAEYGHPVAKRLIGKLYLTGYKTERPNLEVYETLLPCDTINAVFWLDEAAKSGDVEAAKIAAAFYLGGIGIEKNETRAYYLYASNEAQIDYDVKYGLGICHYYGLGTLQNEDAALDYLIATEDWHNEVPYLIAQIYLKRSDARAIKYLNKILQRKNVYAGIMRKTLQILSDCNRHGKCGLSVNIAEAERLEEESKKFALETPQQLQNFFVSLTKINFENESL